MLNGLLHLASRASGWLLAILGMYSHDGNMIAVGGLLVISSCLQEIGEAVKEHGEK